MGLPLYFSQFPEEETIPIFSTLRNAITTMDYKEIPAPRYFLHDGLEYPPSLMAISNEGELK